ncbi:unnamed protein product, partial [Mesorhabditis spiculigera]
MNRISTIVDGIDLIVGVEPGDRDGGGVLAKETRGKSDAKGRSKISWDPTVDEIKKEPVLKQQYSTKLATTAPVTTALPEQSTSRAKAPSPCEFDEDLLRNLMMAATIEQLESALNMRGYKPSLNENTKKSAVPAKVVEPASKMSTIEIATKHRIDYSETYAPPTRGRQPQVQDAGLPADSGPEVVEAEEEEPVEAPKKRRPFDFTKEELEQVAGYRFATMEDAKIWMNKHLIVNNHPNWW